MDTNGHHNHDDTGHERDDPSRQDRREDLPGVDEPGKQAPGAPPTDPVEAPGKPDPRAGVDREVGDIEDPDASDDGALPGRVGGGLAGG